MKPVLYLQPIYHPNIPADHRVWVCLSPEGWTMGQTPMEAWERYRGAKEGHERAIRVAHEERCLEVGAWLT